MHSLIRSALALGATFAGVFFFGSCSLVVDSASSCSSDEDCVNLAGTSCQDGECKDADKCKSSSECSGATNICRQTQPRMCVELLTEECQLVEGTDPKSENSILVGVTGPRTNASGAPVSTGIGSANGATLAVEEFNDVGTFSGSKRFSLLICDDKGDSPTAFKVGRHFADAGIQAVIGPSFSGNTIRMTTGDFGDDNPMYNPEGLPGTAAQGVLNISTSATSPAVTTIADADPNCVQDCGGDAACEEKCPGLVWRTSPSDVVQADAVVKFFPELETAAKNRLSPAGTSVKVFILNKGDAYGQGLRDPVRDNLIFNGMKAAAQPGQFQTAEYGGDTINFSEIIADTKGKAALDAAIAFQPDIVLIFGTDEVVAIFDYIENGWTGAAGTEPFYLFADGGLINSICEDDDPQSPLIGVCEKNTMARTRIRGTVPGANSALFTNFTQAYNTKFPGGGGANPDTFGAAGAYDAIHMLAYSTTIAGDKPLTGAQFALGFAQLISGTGVNAGRTGQSTAIPALQQSGGTINFEGASGPLDFDLKTGEASSDIQIWCLPVDFGVASGRYYDAKSKTMKGNLDSRCAP
jgi:ABC-type branched-subunit amino acid transport system substrate-binding protein